MTVLFARKVIVGGALVLLSGCRSEAGPGLPPATGSGAPAAPAIPKLTDVASAAPTASAAPASAWTGTLYARHDAELGPKMSGVLSQVTVEEGDKVKKGQLLFRLDAASAYLGVNQAKAAIATATVARDAAKVEFQRAADLYTKGSIAPAVYDQAKATYDQATMSLEQGKVALQLAQRGAFDTAIYSPIDGVVTSKLKSVGETVTMVPPTTVLVVQDIAHLELRAKLPEKTLATLAPGTELRVTARSVDIERAVHVKRINPAIDPKTRTVEVVADVDNTDGKLKVGMFVEVALKEPAASVATGSADVTKVASDVGAKAP